MKATKKLALPTIYFQGERDCVNPPKASEMVAQMFTGDFERVLLPSVGHFPTLEPPLEVATRLTRFFGQMRQLRLRADQ